ncbi:ATP-binding cassette domain-containing protein [Prochlorococcus marinus]|uniref:ABC transporter ATP-binding protein n=1 Tax=Prochlorococcus marinus XMU1408 TaxID=2213228 RepID=A0A318R5V6_PROMR|nr:ABC transporter ATP-binding protein [Prochlorococcus marinus]MBW3041823.1 hypothetical protein [Prochlorococcus marinus str. XMU1408]PYE02962.1 hypothetical protein DNJ73_04230 [Prochlorococcus marinus XMU1408]
MKQEHSIKLIQKVLSILELKEKIKLAKLLILMCIVGLMDAISIASIIPVLKIISQKEDAFNNYESITNYLNIINIGDINLELLTILIALFATFIITLSTLFKIYSQYKINKFVEFIRDNIAVRLLKKYISKKYNFIYKKDSADISKLILSEVDQFIIQVFRPTMLLMTNVIILIFITTYLYFTDPKATLLSITFIGIFYIVFYSIVKKETARIGIITSEANKERFKMAKESFESIKDIKIYAAENFFINRFKIPSRRFAEKLADYQTINESPKYLLELFAFSGLMIITVFYRIESSNSLNGLTMLGTFAFAAYRLQPSLTAIFHGLSSIKYGSKIVKNILTELKEENTSNNNFIKYINFGKFDNRSIEIKNMNFHHNNNNINILNNINLKLEKKGLLLVIGNSGSGKSTLLDIIKGLITATSGEIIISEEFNKENLISYLHQDYSLYDDTISSNVAFGVNKELIDKAKLIYSLKKANIWSHIRSLPKGINFRLGERGQNFSGGQKQRIAFARAIYFNPKILILDEPTSSLDFEVEKELNNIILEISKKSLVIMATHKLTVMPPDTDVAWIDDKGELNLCKLRDYKSIKQ